MLKLPMTTSDAILEQIFKIVVPNIDLDFLENLKTTELRKYIPRIAPSDFRKILKYKKAYDLQRTDHQ